VKMERMGYKFFKSQIKRDVQRGELGVKKYEYEYN